MESETMKDDGKGPILHVIVVGFHHKKGCQVEYSFPPLVDGAEPDSNACPAGWKYLPTLALPDGSHNFDEDTVYFHLPSLTDSKETVYGISCFRQIPVEKLKNRTADITRGTVQKSVCALSTLPLYGHIQVKMALITHAYFEEGDFSQVKLLQDTFYHLNSCLSEVDPLQFTPQLYVGLSVRDFILQFRHKTLLLFKLLLLERRLVFYRSPVQPLCSSILSLLSLHPGMLENGLRESACVKPSRPMSPVPDYDDSSVEIVLERPLENVCDTNITSEEENYKNELNELRQSIDCTPHISDIDSKEKQDNNISDNTISISQINYGNDDKNKLLDENIKNDTDSSGFESSPISNSESVSENVDCNVSIYEHQPDMMDNKVQEDMIPSSDSQNDDKWMEVCTPCDNKLKTSDSGNSLSISNATRSSQNLHRDTSTDTICDSTSVQSNMNSIAQIPTEQCGLPLPIFTLGYLCHPYLSLPYLDLLSDINVRGYVVGATNVLFKQKKQLADVLIEVEGCKVETQDPELRRQLHLTTEDLRFADFVVRHVAEERHDVFLDGVGWEGGDEWIRAQFRVYLLCLLRTSLLQDGSRELEHFNSNFISAWKSTHNYKMWVSGENKGIWEVNPGHPFAGQLSVADMKLRLSHTMQNTEGGRKLNQAMVSTGRAVATTGRAVGGAISHAKGALSNWWSTLTTAQSPENGTSRAENDTDVTEATEAEEAVEDSETEDPEPKS